jgi:DNA processing protein
MSEWDREQREAYLTLALVPGIGAARLRALLQRFDLPTGALAAPFEFLCAVQGVSAAAASAIARADRRAGRKALQTLEQVGGSFLLPHDPEFPDLLRQIPEPPTYLFLQGKAALLERPAVAIVGSRDHSQYGAEVCRAIARAAAEAGLVVVSGMARGLDAVAHAGALDVNGATIGVLGNGLGVIYPAANRKLYEEVSGQGLLLTEFPPGERPGKGNFPRRNRLISGLARVTVVVEAAKASGALQTVACAQEQGREVLAVPGPITSIVSGGTNGLLRDGAGPLLELADLLDHYPELKRTESPTGSQPASEPLPLERRILNALQVEPLPAEQLVEVSGAPVTEALDVISALELRGKLRLGAGGRYRLVVEGLFR